MKAYIPGVVLCLAAQAWGSEADPSFRLEVKRGTASTACAAVRIVSGKSDLCFAATARKCLGGDESETGAVVFQAREFGEQKAQYFTTPGDAALLSWKCGGSEFHAPYFYLPDKKAKLPPGAPVKYGRIVPGGGGLPPQLAAGQVVGGNAKETVIRTPGYKLVAQDLGRPLFCADGNADNSSGALCGFLVSADDSRFATGEVMDFIRAKLRALGVPEPKYTVHEGKLFPLVED